VPWERPQPSKLGVVVAKGPAPRSDPYRADRDDSVLHRRVCG